MKNFICSNCCQEKKIEELASTVPVYKSEPTRTCRSCYDLYHNPPKKKLKKQSFYCDYCRQQVFGVLRHRRVDVSMPNELDMKKGKAYNLCSLCDKKVKEYNSDEDRDWEKNPPEPWE